MCSMQYYMYIYVYVAFLLQCRTLIPTAFCSTLFFVPKMPSYLILVRLGRNVQSSNFIFKFIFRLCNLSGKFHDKCEENKPNSELNGDRLERSIYGHS